jgi:hypothetical protein
MLSKGNVYTGKEKNEKEKKENAPKTANGRLVK